MPDGLLIARGTLSLDLFWPDGESDGDTVKLTLAAVDPFSFSANGDRMALQPTRAFEGAVVKGAASKRPIDKKNRMTIRLQGVDTPELHYAPSPLPKRASIADSVRSAYRALCRQYRQALGESAPLALRMALTGSAATVLPCRVETRVDQPNEVFDTYGRFIGDVIVEGPGADLNLNRFLVQEGWAFPAFYVSMRPDEIQVLLALARAAREAKEGVWRSFKRKPGKFDFDMRYRPGKTVKNPKPGKDAGSVLFPKFFRRQTTWACQRSAGVTDEDFRSFLKASPDRFVTTTTFLNGTPESSTVDATYKRGMFELGPEDIVFDEKPSTLVGADGKPVKAWFAAGVGV